MKTKIFLIAIFTCLALGCNGQQKGNSYKKPDLDYSKLDSATFAGGCFWCVEASFDQIRGVAEAVSGYAGGKEKNPTYSQVGSGRTGHTETVQIYYNPAVIDYSTLLQIFFTAHDPTQLNRQGPDIGKQYRSSIFYHNKEQKKLAEEEMRKVDANSGTVVTELVPFTNFWIAEDYHQDYEKHHPNDAYIRNVSQPKIKKVAQKFSHLLKE